MAAEARGRRLIRLLVCLVVLTPIAQARPWQEDSLFYQPRLADLEYSRAYGLAPGTAPWQRAELPDAARLARRESPGALLLAVAEALGLERALGDESWELVARLQTDARGAEATGALLEWGFKDDAVAGADWRLVMRRSDDGWQAAALWWRAHCRRRVSEGLCL